jgi:hypothetical protein
MKHGGKHTRMSEASRLTETMLRIEIHRAIVERSLQLDTRMRWFGLFSMGNSMNRSPGGD